MHNSNLRKTLFRNTRVQHAVHEHAIVEHVTRHLARPSFVLHELESQLVHVDIHVVRPAPNHDFWFLFTTGMSAHPMRKPSGVPGPELAEVSLLLPRDWPLDNERWRSDTRWSWPIHELAEAARMPHRFQTWLAAGHAIIPITVSTSFTSRSLDASTRLSSLFVLAADSDLLPAGIDVIDSGKQRIDLLTLIAVYPEELDYQLEHGLDGLLERFSAAGISDVIKPTRPSAIAANVGN